MKVITSRDNPFFKQLIKLEKSARQRKMAGLTLLDGVHLISAYKLALGPPQSLIVSESGCENEEIKCLLAEQEDWNRRGCACAERCIVPRSFSRQDSHRYHGAGAYSFALGHPYA